MPQLNVTTYVTQYWGAFLSLFLLLMFFEVVLFSTIKRSWSIRKFFIQLDWGVVKESRLQGKIVLKRFYVPRQICKIFSIMLWPCLGLFLKFIIFYLGQLLNFVIFGLIDWNSIFLSPALCEILGFIDWDSIFISHASYEIPNEPPMGQPPAPDPNEPPMGQPPAPDPNEPPIGLPLAQIVPMPEIIFVEEELSDEGER